MSRLGNEPGIRQVTEAYVFVTIIKYDDMVFIVEQIYQHTTAGCLYFWKPVIVILYQRLSISDILPWNISAHGQGVYF